MVYSDIQGHLLSWLFLRISSERKNLLLNIKYSTFYFFSSFFLINYTYTKKNKLYENVYENIIFQILSRRLIVVLID